MKTFNQQSSGTTTVALFFLLCFIITLFYSCKKETVPPVTANKITSYSGEIKIEVLGEVKFDTLYFSGTSIPYFRVGPHDTNQNMAWPYVDSMMVNSANCSAEELGNTNGNFEVNVVYNDTNAVFTLNMYINDTLKKSYTGTTVSGVSTTMPSTITNIAPFNAFWAAPKTVVQGIGYY